MKKDQVWDSTKINQYFSSNAELLSFETTGKVDNLLGDQKDDNDESNEKEEENSKDTKEVEEVTEQFKKSLMMEDGKDKQELKTEQNVQAKTEQTLTDQSQPKRDSVCGTILEYPSQPEQNTVL